MARFVIALIAASWIGCASTQANAEREVRALERTWLDAYEARDSAAMARILAPDFTITYPNGAVQSTADVLAFLDRQRESGAVAPRFHTESTTAQVYPSAVVLTGVVVTEKLTVGAAVRSAQRYTDTYVRIGGRWRVVSSHLSHMP